MLFRIEGETSSAKMFVDSSAANHVSKASVSALAKCYGEELSVGFSDEVK